MAKGGNKSSSGKGNALKASKMAAKGSVSQKNILTHRICTACRKPMRQDEIGIEMVYRAERQPGELRRERVFKHTKNCIPL